MGNDRPEGSEVFMRRAMFVGLAALAMGMMAGCSDGSIGDTEGANAVAPDPTQQLLIDGNTDTVTTGRFITANEQLSFVITTEGDTQTLKLQFNGKTFDVTINASVMLDGHDAVLTDADKALLQSFVQHLAVRIRTLTTGVSGLEKLGRMTEHLIDAPVGYAHSRLVNGVLTPEGVAPATETSAIRCITKGMVYNAKYTNKAGAVVIGPVLAGSNWLKNASGTSGDYSCMGKCGGGCNGLFSSPYYTMDCLNHDTCSHDMNSSGGGSDTHGCADEYRLATDDMKADCSSAHPENYYDGGWLGDAATR